MITLEIIGRNDYIPLLFSIRMLSPVNWNPGISVSFCVHSNSLKGDITSTKSVYKTSKW